MKIKYKRKISASLLYFLPSKVLKKNPKAWKELCDKANDEAEHEVEITLRTI